MHLACPPKTGRRSIRLISIGMLAAASAQAFDTNAFTTLRSNLTRLRFYRRRWFVAKFAVTDSAARVCDVAAGPKRDCSEQYDCDAERNGRSRPAQRNDDACSAKCGNGVEEINQLFSTLLVLVEPRMSIVVGHGQNTVVSLFAVFIDRPCGN